MNIRNQKGINMITLSIAVIILIIITSILVYNARDGVKVKTLNNLYNDIEQLNNKVSSYYVEHGDIPKSAKYENLDFLNAAENNQINPNNGSDFYVINLKALEGISLNYGRGFDSISTTDTTVVAIDDIYIINEVSHTIYYPRGIEVQGTRYYTEPDNWTNIDLSLIPIYTAEQLSWVGDGTQHAVNGVNYTFSLDGAYVLKNDIDLSSVCSEASGTSWTPIGTASNPFEGKFYGNGHEVQNLYINSNENSQGLFGKNSGIIKNITVKGKVTGGRNVAGIIGENSDNGKIQNCINYANVEGVYTGDVQQIGGIAGGNISDISNCYNYGVIVSNTNTSSGGAEIGGICGYTRTGVVKNCYNYGSVSSTSSTNSIGGIAGKVGYNIYNGTIQDCYNYGEVSGYEGVGGIVRTYCCRREPNYFMQ